MTPDAAPKERWQMLLTDCQRRTLRVGEWVAVRRCNCTIHEGRLRRGPWKVNGAWVVWVDGIAGTSDIARVVGVRLAPADARPNEQPAQAA